MGPLALTFAAPAALLGLIALPAIYLLLRVTPPRPREIVFPPIRLLLDLLRREETPARTPLWLLLLRLAVAACAIFAMAGPTLAPTASTPFSRAPLLLAIDDGWPAAPDFDRRIEAARALALEAARNGAAVAALPMSEADSKPALDDGGKIDERLRALAPKPYIPDRAAAAARLASFVASHKSPRVVWIGDGLEQGGARAFADALVAAKNAGADVRILADSRVARALVAPSNRAGALEVEAIRAASDAASSGRVSAFDAQGRVIAQAPFAFDGDKATARFDLPIELRNDVVLLRLEGEPSAGAVALLDGRSKVRRVAVLSGTSVDLAQPLLAPQYYLAKAFAPFAEVRAPKPGVAEPLLGLVADHPDMIALADIGVVPGEELDALTRFVEEGGVLLRFAGPRLANGADELTPVRLRRNGRVLGGAMSWDSPKTLAPFEPGSPFFGLPAPEEVTVTRQVLAEPEPGLPAKTWATLTDGTPLVTAERRGKGLIVLFHVSADATWSDLPISGLFVEMLRRIAAESGASAAHGQAAHGQEGGAAPDAALAPLLALDGRGVMRAPPPMARPIPGDFNGPADRDHPPGFYGSADAPVAVQPLRPDDELRRLDYATLGLPLSSLQGDAPLDLRPTLLALVFLGLLADWAILLALAGAFRARATAAVCLLALLGVAAPRAEAKDAPRAGATLTQRDREAALTSRLAYVVSGDARVDETSRLGLEALSRALAQRTSYSPGQPVGVDPARDELAFYPMLYWPIVATAPLPSSPALAKVGIYLKQGGTIVFDTRDALVAHPGGPPTAETKWLREVTRNLDIPELEVVPRDHVITKTFYLLDGFFGRTVNGKTWVEALPPERKDDSSRPVRATDSVSPVVITSNDLAGAWAAGPDGRALYTLTPGGARQRELAIRGGVNLVMYTLTGNYKSDQVHVRDLLERLGQ
ncbi:MULTISPECIES: DUF4159 domain-containing protein [Methylosinus]|uniref:LytTR family transcriptional regulator n=1 Tax=Methylosinus trichosporium (strain ATCC 35070 / NCIMB 11131 / UNIQEM 75 / OB3b) TaxID=595536 RepID=A0A2D2D5G0_METT3|nr:MULTISPECIES: DUF4159 domain-containing protein [Methylosinus]ATQ70069.1 LytTR family transcriptional regulator [Methylosinus trichosporium OB3b]OBS54421.1 LytTR family transcriptional regulator [Methylosinus sp. 3S-1]